MKNSVPVLGSAEMPLFRYAIFFRSFHNIHTALDAKPSLLGSMSKYISASRYVTQPLR